MAELVTKADLRATMQEFRTTIAELRHAMEMQTLQLTVRFGVMLAVWVVAAAAILKLVR